MFCEIRNANGLPADGWAKIVYISLQCIFIHKFGNFYISWLPGTLIEIKNAHNNTLHWYECAYVAYVQYMWIYICFRHNHCGVVLQMYTVYSILYIWVCSVPQGQQWQKETNTITNGTHPVQFSIWPALRGAAWSRKLRYHFTNLWTGIICLYIRVRVLFAMCLLLLLLLLRTAVTIENVK